jgi:hypothetical protein
MEHLANQPPAVVEVPKDKDGTPLMAPPKPMPQVFSSPTKLINEVGYWLLPKPMDMGVMLYDVMIKGDVRQAGAPPELPKDPAIQFVQQQGWMYPEISVLTSLLAAVVILAWAGVEFSGTDY